MLIELSARQSKETDNVLNLAIGLSTTTVRQVSREETHPVHDHTRLPHSLRTCLRWWVLWMQFTHVPLIPDKQATLSRY